MKDMFLILVLMATGCQEEALIESITINQNSIVKTGVHSLSQNEILLSGTIVDPGNLAFALRGTVSYDLIHLENTKRPAFEVIFTVLASLKPITPNGGLMTVHETTTHTVTLSELSTSSIESTSILVGTLRGKNLHMVFGVSDSRLHLERIWVSTNP